MFAIVISCIVAIGGIANWSLHNVAPDPDHPIADVLKRFDLGHEPSLPAFYSAVVILMCAMVLSVIARQSRRDGDGRSFYWWVLCLGFTAMAIDEAVMIHEMADAAVHTWIPTSGLFYFAWVLPAIVGLLALAIFFAKFLFSLDRQTRFAFVISGAIFVGGAVGMELVAGLIFDAAESEAAALRSVAHVISQMIEEGMEMIGIAMFLIALIGYLGRNHRSVTFEIETGSSQQHNTSAAGDLPADAC